MEEITVKIFDQRLQYDVCYKRNFTWYVMNKSIMEFHNDESVHNANHYDICQFVCVYAVHAVPEGFMLCTCGYIHEYMVPCVHLMAVLSDSKFLISSMFHISWWKHYNYFFCTEFGMNQYSELHKQMNRMHKLRRI